MTRALAALCPALAAWRERLASRMLSEDPGRSSTWIFDALWRAACWEATAVEAADVDQRDLWRYAMRRAREAMAEAAT